MSLVAIPGQIVLGHLSDRVGREWAWGIGCFGFGVCLVTLIALAGSLSPLLPYVMIIVQGGHLGAPRGRRRDLRGRTLRPHVRYADAVGLVGGAVGPFLTGTLHDRLGSYTPAFAVAVGLSGLSLLAIWHAAPRKVRTVAGRTRCSAA